MSFQRYSDADPDLANSGYCYFMQGLFISLYIRQHFITYPGIYTVRTNSEKFPNTTVYLHYIRKELIAIFLNLSVSSLNTR